MSITNIVSIAILCVASTTRGYARRERASAASRARRRRVIRRCRRHRRRRRRRSRCRRATRCCPRRRHAPSNRSKPRRRRRCRFVRTTLGAVARRLAARHALRCRASRHPHSCARSCERTRVDMRVRARASVCSALGVDAGVVDCDARANVFWRRMCSGGALEHAPSTVRRLDIRVQFSYKYFDKTI